MRQIKAQTHTPVHPLTLSFCEAVAPTPDRAEKDLVNIVLGRKQSEWGRDNRREKTSETERKNI